MKLYISFFIGILQIINIEAQDLKFNINSLNESDYRKFFPLSIQDGRIVPTNDVVCILPTNEQNKELQKEATEYYLNTFINGLIFLTPSQHSKILTDKEALHQDLSNYNIRTFGTIKGNLWTKWYLENTKDFPIKIYNDSIIADSVYHGNCYAFSAIWFNPFNYRRSVVINAPQQLENYRYQAGCELTQFCIFKDHKLLNAANYYHIKISNISFSDSIRSAYQTSNYLSNSHFDEIDLGLYRYPSIEQLKPCLISEKIIDYDLVRIPENSDDLYNSSSMEWLKNVAKKYKVIALGENHHFAYNGLFAQKLLFTINTYSYFPLLILEMPYSYAGYINHYIFIKDDNEAVEFRKVLRKIEAAKLPTYDALRAWNKNHPNKLISVGCSDLEQDYLKTITAILNPYLQIIDPSANLTFKRDSFQVYLNKAETLLKIAKIRNIIGEFTFQTPTYMQSVLENLKSSIPIKLDPKNYMDHTARFKVMIRNVTDEKFLGKKISELKIMFWGGYEHFRILNTYNDEVAKQTEGYFLARQFGPTKGKVYSIRLNTLGYCLRDSFRHIDPRLGFSLEPKMVKLFYERKVKLNEPVIDKYTTELDEFIYRLSHKFPNKAIRIKKIKLKGIYKLDYWGYNRYNLLKDVGSYSEFNTTIVVPFAPIGDY